MKSPTKTPQDIREVTSNYVKDDKRKPSLVELNSQVYSTNKQNVRLDDRKNDNATKNETATTEKKQHRF